MTPSVEELAYESAKRAIDRQAQALDNLRVRSGTLIAAAALVASFLGVPALQSGAHSTATALGIVALVAVLGLNLAILWPHRFTFRLSAGRILDDGADMAFLARSLETHHDTNETTLQRLHRCFSWACVALVVETVALLAAL